MTLSVEIPDKLVPQLQQRARRAGKKPDDIVVEMVEKGLTTIVELEPITERQCVRAILNDAGFLSEVSPELMEAFVQPRSPEEREQMRQRLQQISLAPPLSETIIADRGPV